MAVMAPSATGTMCLEGKRNPCLPLSGSSKRKTHLMPAPPLAQSSEPPLARYWIDGDVPTYRGRKNTIIKPGVVAQFSSRRSWDQISERGRFFFHILSTSFLRHIDPCLRIACTSPQTFRAPVLWGLSSRKSSWRCSSKGKWSSGRSCGRPSRTRKKRKKEEKKRH